VHLYLEIFLFEEEADEEADNGEAHEGINRLRLVNLCNLRGHNGGKPGKGIAEGINRGH